MNLRNIITRILRKETEIIPISVFRSDDCPTLIWQQWKIYIHKVGKVDDEIELISAWFKHKDFKQELSKCPDITIDQINWYCQDTMKIALEEYYGEEPW